MPPTEPYDTEGAIAGLVAGFRVFRTRNYGQHGGHMRELATHGQSPEVMIVACSDSRVDPALLLGAQPGDLFTVRNVANLVPPYSPDSAYHGTSAALEYAVRDLAVRHIVVLGHSACGGIQALRAAASGSAVEREFINPWMQIAAAACPCSDGEPVPDQQSVEHDGIRISLENLRSFPWVDEQIRAGRLTLHGWWVELMEGRLCQIAPEGGIMELVPATTEVSGAAD